VSREIHASERDRTGQPVQRPAKRGIEGAEHRGDGEYRGRVPRWKRVELEPGQRCCRHRAWAADHVLDTELDEAGRGEGDGGRPSGPTCTSVAQGVADERERGAQGERRQAAADGVDHPNERIERRVLHVRHPLAHARIDQERCGDDDEHRGERGGPTGEEDQPQSRRGRVHPA